MITTNNKGIDLQPERWGTAGTLLSLDCIQPFVAPMGILLDSKTLKGVMREAITENRTLFERQSANDTLFSRILLDLLDEKYGTAGKGQFTSWLSSVFTFDVHDHSAWQQWQSAFSRLSDNAAQWAKLPVSAEDSGYLYEKYQSIMYQVDIWALWKEVKRSPLSDWDLEMYSIHEFDDEAKDPFNWVVLTYETKCFRQFWVEVRKLLSEQKLAELWRWFKDDPHLRPGSHMHSLPDPLTLSAQEL